MPESTPQPFPATPRTPYGLLLGALAGGFLGGILLTALTMKVLMPGMMLTTHVSQYGTVEETCAALEAAIAAEGWNVPSVRNLNASTEKQGIELTRVVRIVELCKAEYARDVLETNPEVSTLMPCAFGVYEGDDGRVYITGMNTGLMGTMFGGRIAEVMGGSVAADEARMLAAVVGH